MAEGHSADVGLLGEGLVVEVLLVRRAGDTGHQRIAFALQLLRQLALDHDGARVLGAVADAGGVGRRAVEDGADQRQRAAGLGTPGASMNSSSSSA